MKATCRREDLLTAFQMVAGVVPARSPKAILLNVKLIMDKENAFLMATDLEVGIRHKVEGIQVNQPGEVVLPTTRVIAILRESSDEEIEISLDQTKIVLKGNRSKFQLPSEAPEEFPEVPDFEQGNFHKVPAPLFRSMIRRTIFSTDSESMRFALNGLLVELEGDSITMVGTDGRRLAVMRGSAKVEGDHSTKDSLPVIPTKAMQLIDRNLQGIDGDVDLAILPNKVLLRSQNAVISSRLVEGRYPRYQDVFPKAREVQIVLNVKDFLQSIRQAAIVTNEESRGVRATFKEGVLSFAAQAAEVGESEVDLPISYTGPEITINFDPRYLIDMFRVLNEESTVTLDLINHESAAVFRTDDGYSYVVMPLTRERDAR